MNEITQIHLGRQAFTISIDAHKLLRDYLQAVKKHSGNSNEVVEEVEIRMTELLLERGITGDKVLLAKDVEYLKRQLGEPKDFDDEAADDDVKAMEDDSGVRRLFRDTDNGMIAGVAAGLATYFDIDTIIVRLIFIALVFFGGSGVLLYVILWLLVPEAKTNSERLQMRGLAVNVENIKEVLSNADVPGATRRASRVVSKVISTVASIVLRIVGLVFVVIGVAIIIGGAVTAIYSLIRGAQVAGATIFPVGREEVAVLVCGFVILAIVAGLLVATGVGLVRRKLSVPGWAVAAVIGVFIVAASVGVGLGFDVAPNIKARYESLQHVQTYSVASVKSIHIVGGNVYYSVVQGDKPEVEVRSFGKVDTHGTAVTTDPAGKLTIDATKFTVHPSDCRLVCSLSDNQETKIIIHVPNLGTVPIESPSDVRVELKNDTVGYVITELNNGSTILATPQALVPPTPPKPIGN